MSTPQGISVTITRAQLAPSEGGWGLWLWGCHGGDPTGAALRGNAGSSEDPQG